MKKAGICAVLAAGLSFSTGLAAKELRWTHFGVRPLGMGNAFVAVVDDFNALFYNPAGLARLETWDGEFFNPTLEISDTTIEFIDDLSKLAGSGGGGTDATLKILQEQTGKHHHFAYSMTPHLVFKNFGFGLGFLIDTTMVVHSDIDIELDSGLKIVAPFSYARSFLDNKLSVGGSIKLLSTAGVDRSFNIQTISAFSGKNEDGEDSEEIEIGDYVLGGTGVGADLGILFTPVKTMEPTLGLSITDVGGSTYEEIATEKGNLGAPKARLPSVNTGISAKPFQLGKSYVLVAADAHMINQPVHYSHKFNLGLEYGYGTIIKLQTGLKEGYLTAGLQFEVPLLSLRFATYTVDHAPVVGLNDDLTERRFVLQLKLLI